MHELSFFIHGKEIFGSPSVTFYHKSFEIVNQILRGDFPSLKVTSDSGLFIVTLKLDKTEASKEQRSSINYLQETPLENSTSAVNSNSKDSKNIVNQYNQDFKNIEIMREIQKYFAPLGKIIIDRYRVI